MTESTEYSIGEAAQALGVTTKALRHWDDIGLLSPTWRTWSDYRLYTDRDLERGAAIVLYRNAGMKLADIRTLVDDPSSSTITRALKCHHAELLRQKRSVMQQLEAVTELIGKAEKGMEIMDDMTKYLGGNMPAYQEEARQRWGDSPEWAQSQAKMETMKEADWANVKAEQQAFAADLARAKVRGVAPGSPEALVLVDKHREMIGQWYKVTRSRQLILARMYTQDARFSAAYGGAEGYLLELVDTQAKLEGIDEPSWD
ncbi:MerR family transcriptional regulator [Corynebacterium breve]|uniref:MerR family transcriptional regulator n=1 Tax=Corynebacterium breve TaxID=3049799 RepID=A0ABY8VID3_9CORY|nr:MerR family transcriptional regulator [Corynebacterium breve]WIM67325.1 MerR family transcriptional regulator [Corynebacterium breve]